MRQVIQSLMVRRDLQVRPCFKFPKHFCMDFLTVPIYATSEAELMSSYSFSHPFPKFLKIDA